MEILSWALARDVVTVSAEVYARYRRKMRFAAAPPPSFKCPPNPRNNPRQYLLYVGRLSPEKGIDRLIKAYLRAGAPCPLWIAGDGPMRALVEKLARHPQVTYLGKVPREELPNVYRGAIALKVPSYTEAWGHVITEAKTCGVPHVITPENLAISKYRKTTTFRDEEHLAQLINAICAYYRRNT
ncbi:glycosyltransferase, partial [Pyrobaculum sp.]|uniref:glycosyltransferase n=1 Tax=Pyrobaculum sp. TaxID=2004705 RepID=UPI003D11A9F5